MIVASLEVGLRLDGCRSLKDKRHVIRGLQERLRRSFHIAVAEVDDQDLWNVATLGIAAVGDDPRHLESVLQHLLDAIDGEVAVDVEYEVRKVEAQ